MNLVVGASGLLGGTITRALLAQGAPVRILSRSNPAYRALEDRGAEMSEGDLKDPATLRQAMKGVTTVITTANAAQRDGAGEGVDTFESVDRSGNQNLIDAAVSTGVGQFIFTSAFTADKESPSSFMAIKGRIEESLAASGLNYTILAPHVFMEVWFGMVIGTALQSGEPVTLIGNGDKRHSFVSVEDVASVALASIGNAAAMKQRVPIGGPDALTWTDVVSRVGKVIHRELPVRYLPIGSALPIPESTWDLMYAMEMFEAVIPTEPVESTYGVKLTSIEQVARKLFVV